MTREDKIKLAISKGYTYNISTGEISKPNGELISSRNKGYLFINIYNDDDGITYRIRAHHFAYYYTYGFCPYKVDHKNRDRISNTISNLRESSYLIDNRNRNSKGYCFDKKRNKWISQIMVNRKSIYLGRFDTKEDARNAYIEAKKKYHPEYNA